MSHQCEVDIAIVGAGIAGLWLYHLLQQQGLQVVLLEKQTIGGAQSGYSQGILHGGLKYSLNGLLSQETSAIQQAPAIWQACLAGDGKIDLRQVHVNAAHHHLFTNNTLSDKLTGFVAQHSLQSHCQLLKHSHYPCLLQDQQFRGRVYRLEETILELPSLLSVLAKPYHHGILKISHCELQWHNEKEISSLLLTNEQNEILQLSAKQFIFTAGKNNAELLGKFAPAMQIRPLHMVKVTKPDLPVFFGHAMGKNSKPLLTITSHAQNGETLWYLGGQLAEEGISRNEIQQRVASLQLLKKLFPWHEWSTAELECLRIERAEAKQSNGSKPNSFSLFQGANWQCAWPSKLVLAPMLAEAIQNHLPNALSKKALPAILQQWPKAELFQYKSQIESLSTSNA